MNKAGSAAKVKLNSFDDLFGASEMSAGTAENMAVSLQVFPQCLCLSEITTMMKLR